ncbi:hypothetical protein ABZS83_20005 [Streptomyces sp. NPDC005426]|uniref:hypothetical protein n=1 Tax=Streptomyces sp. NPDC005426 TaxID=3155344 RepID=UPI0033A97E59
MTTPAPTHATWEATEVTQSVQDLQHRVALITGKVTVIRVYIRGTSGPATGVRGTVTLVRSTTDPGVKVTSVNTIALDPDATQDLAARRADANLSLNFLVPPSLTAEGPLSVSSVTLSDALTGAALPLAATGTGPTVLFRTSPPLRIRVFGLRYTLGSPPVTFSPEDRDFTALVSWLKRAYPVAEVINSHTVIDAAAAPPFKCEDTNAQLAAIRALDISAGGDRRTHYLGQVADGGFFLRGCSSGLPASPDPSTVASSPCGSASFGWDFDGTYGDWYGSHELGHTFGRRHPGFCGESADDRQNYPFQDGQLADGPDTFVGFDVGDPALNLPMKARPGMQWHDVMTYCDRQWVSSYTYEGIRRRLVAEDSLVAGAPPPEGTPAAAAPTPAPLTVFPVAGPPEPAGGRPDERFPNLSVTRVAPEAEERAFRAAGAAPEGEQLVSVVGMVNLTQREGGIRFVNPVTPLAAQPAQLVGAAPDGETAGPDGGTPVVLRILQADGTAPREIPVAVKPASELGPNDDRTGLVDTVVPVGPSPEAIELVVGGQVVDTFRPGSAPPALRAARHASAGDRAFGLALDFDNGPEAGQTFAAQVSTDGGSTWQTIGVGLKEPLIQVDRSQFRPGQQVQLRIITTNGFTSSAADIQTIQV